MHETWPVGAGGYVDSLCSRRASSGQMTDPPAWDTTDICTHSAMHDACIRSRSMQTPHVSSEG